MGLFTKLFGTRSEREVKKLEPLVSAVMALDEPYRKLSDDELKAKTAEFKGRLANGETLDDLLVEAFAVCREAADRVLGLRPYRVQVVGGIVLHFLIREDDRVICGVEKLRHAADAGLLSQRMDNASPLLDRRLRR